jgi:hypothetical protein
MGSSWRGAHYGLAAPVLDKGVRAPRDLGVGQMGPMGWLAKENPCPRRTSPNPLAPPCLVGG